MPQSVRAALPCSPFSIGAASKWCEHERCRPPFEPDAATMARRPDRARPAESRRFARLRSDLPVRLARKAARTIPTPRIPRRRGLAGCHPHGPSCQRKFPGVPKKPPHFLNASSRIRSDLGRSLVRGHGFGRAKGYRLSGLSFVLLMQIRQTRPSRWEHGSSSECWETLRTKLSPGMTGPEGLSSDVRIDALFSFFSTRSRHRRARSDAWCAGRLGDYAPARAEADAIGVRAVARKEEEENDSI